VNWLPPAQSGWSWTQLARVIAWILVAQAILVYVLSRRPVRDSTGLPARPSAALVWHDTAPKDGCLDLLPDPAVFARVVSQGFSGSLWVSEASLPNEPATTGPGKFPETLALSRPRLDDSARLIHPTALTQSGMLTLGLGPKPQTQPASLKNSSAAASAVRLADGFTGWQVTLREPLPVWTNSQILAATVVQVVVDEQGGVMSATVKPPGSGLPAADQEALRLARVLRFVRSQPTEGATKPIWGDVEFVWHTAAPADTPQTSSSP